MFDSVWFCKRPYCPRQFRSCPTLYGLASIHLGQDDFVHVRPCAVLRTSILPGRIPSMFDTIWFCEHPFWPDNSIHARPYPVLRVSISARIIPSMFDPTRFGEHSSWPSVVFEPIRLLHLALENSVHVRHYTVLRASILARIIPSMFEPIQFCKHPSEP